MKTGAARARMTLLRAGCLGWLVASFLLAGVTPLWLRTSVTIPLIPPTAAISLGNFKSHWGPNKTSTLKRHHPAMAIRLQADILDHHSRSSSVVRLLVMP